MPDTANELVWHFESAAARAALLREVAEWQGAMFRPRECKKGVAADCVRYAEALLVASGAIAPIQWPRYVTHTGGEAMRDLLLNTLLLMPELSSEWLHPWGADLIPAPLTGDLMVYTNWKSGHHLAVVTEPPKATHCIAPYGVAECNVHDQRALLVAVFRAKAR